MSERERERANDLNVYPLGNLYLRAYDLFTIVNFQLKTKAITEMDRLARLGASPEEQRQQFIQPQQQIQSQMQLRPSSRRSESSFF